MKTILHLLVTAILTLRTSADPLGEHLFPPELLQYAQEEIALTDEQRENLREEGEKLGARFKELQERLQKEVEALAALVKPEHVDTPAALAQLDKLLDAEREVKRVQIGFLIAIKNQLTPEQQTKLIAFRKAHGLDRAPMEELQKRLTEKAGRVRDGVEKLVGKGGDPASIKTIMEEVSALMQQGKHKEAEAGLDRALKELGEEE